MRWPVHLRHISGTSYCGLKGTRESKNNFKKPKISPFSKVQMLKKNKKDEEQGNGQPKKREK